MELGKYLYCCMINLFLLTLLNIVRFVGMAILLAILFSLLFCGCQLFTAPELLSTAERQMTEHPDSALETMRSIKKYAVLLPERRAKYGLLYSAALDKNRIDIASDSLIRFSTEYYDLHGTAEERMRSYYYLGRTQQHAGKNLAATLSYLDAEQYTDVVDDNYLKGLLYSSLAEVYEIQFRYKSAFEMAERSYNYYKKANLERHQAYQLYYMGTLCRMFDEKCGISLLKEAIVLADKTEFFELKSFCYISLVILYDDIKQYDEAYSIIKLLDNYTSSNYIRYIGSVAHVFHRKGKIKEGEQLIDYGWSVAKDCLDSSIMYHYQSKIHLYNNDRTQYLADYQNAAQLQLKQASDIAENPIATAEIEYFEQKSKAELGRARQEKVVVILLSVLSVVVLCSVVYRLSKRQINKKNSEIQRYIETISSLKNSVVCSENEILSGKFETINQLCTAYYEAMDNPKQKAIVFKKVANMIAEIGDDNSIQQDVNRYRNNILNDFISDFPNLTKDEYKLACYLFADFSNQSICVVLSCSKEALYNRTYRLREKVKKSNSVRRDNYLQFL